MLRAPATKKPRRLRVAFSIFRPTALDPLAFMVAARGFELFLIGNHSAALFGAPCVALAAPQPRRPQGPYLGPSPLSRPQHLHQRGLHGCGRDLNLFSLATTAVTIEKSI